MICIDSSIAAKWILEEEDSPAAHRLLQLIEVNGHELIAPALVAYEVANILRKRCARFGWPKSDARARMAAFLVFPIKLDDDPRLHEEAIEIATTFDLPEAYDAHYLALCQREGCNFWTADKRLLNTLRGRLPFVHDLATLTDNAIQPAI